MHNCWRLAIWVILVLVPCELAYARPLRRPSLNWVRASGAAQCIDPRALAARVEALTGPVLVPAAEADFLIEALVIPLPKGGFQMRMTVTDRSGAVRGERTIERAGEDCHALDASAAFIIALTIDPDLTLPDDVAALFTREEVPDESLLRELEAEPPRAAAVPVAPTTASEPPAALPPPKAPSPAEKPLRHVVALGVTSLWGAGPAPAPGVTASVSRAVGRIAWGGLVLRATPALRGEALDSTRTLRIQSYDLGLAGCGALSRGRVLGRMCAAFETTLWAGSGRGFQSERDSVLVGTGAALVPQLRVRLRRGFGLRVEGLLRLNLLRRRFTSGSVEGERTVFRVPQFTSGFAIGPDFEF